MRRKPRIHLYRRGATYYCVYRDTEGKRLRASTHQTDRRMAAEAARLIVERHIQGERTAMTRPLALVNCLAAFLASRERKQRSRATMEFYEKQAKSLIRHFGPDYDLRGLKRTALERFLDERIDAGAGRAALKALGMLKSALKHAQRHEEYSGDPTVLFADLGGPSYVPRDRSLSQDEFHALLGAMPQARREYLIAYVYLGVRASELARIRTVDVNLNEAQGTVRVRGTKTAGADRVLPIADALRPVLVRRAARVGDPSASLFPAWGNIRRDLHEGCRRSGIPPVSPNDLRRTFCTWLAEAGVAELTIARLMGHTNSAMVRRVYARIGTHALAAAVDRLPGLPSRNTVLDTQPAPIGVR